MPRLDYDGPIRNVIGTVLVVVLSACAAAAPAATPTREPTIEPPSSTPSGECPPTDPVPVAETSVLVPGPSAGIEPSTAVGERLVLVVTILNSTCAPLVGATVNIHHTDADGVYGPGHGTSQLECCTYQGTVRTDENGRFQLDTVRPGSYAGEAIPPPAHIHLQIEGAEGMGPGEVVFADDPNLPPGAGRDGTVVADLVWVEDSEGGYWSGAVMIVLETP